MNVISRYETDPPIQELVPDTESGENEIALIVGIIRRQLPFILGMIILGLAGAGLYLYTATRWYTASTDVLMEMRRSAVMSQDPNQPDQPIDSSLVESQVETISSERISKAVIKSLNLGKDPEFTEPHYGPFTPAVAKVKQLLGRETSEPMSEEDLISVASGALTSRLKAERVGMTYVIRISFLSRSPEKAARVANQIAEAYISDQLQSKFEASQRAEAWLQERVREMRQQASAAEKSVLDFKLANNIMTSDGKLVDEQRIADYDRTVNEARSRTAEAEARYARITQVINSGQVDGAVTDVLNNNVIVQLRQRYLDTAARLADWTRRYGEQHSAVVNLRNEARQLQQSMLDELKRIQQTYRSDFEIAKSREEAAEKGLTDEFQRSGQARQAQVKLRELEGIAQSTRALYDNFVQRQMQAAQNQTLPITDARVITNAAPPDRHSHPKVPLVLAFGLAAGLGAGIGIGFVRELLNRSIRNKRQLEKASGVPCLGLLPTIKTGAIRATKAEQQSTGREVIPKRSELTFVCRAPFSQFAEGIRAIKLSVDLGLARNSGAVIGVVSSLPSEGKSTVSSNLAFLMAQAGSRVLLVDCDMRNPSLTSGLAPKSESGLRQLLSQTPSDLEGVIWRHSATGLHFLPANIKEAPDNTSSLLSSPAMDRLLKLARAHYDYVVLDFAPMLPVVDVRAAAHLVDGFVMVAGWAQTPMDAVTEAISLSSAVRTRLLGTILNKVDMKQMRRYGEYDGKYYSQYFDR
jgi:succinoglycan biosynthesis transport protein ExoP